MEKVAAPLTDDAQLAGVLEIVTPTDNAYPQARVEITLGDHLTAEGRSCKDTGYIMVRQTLIGVYSEIGTPAAVHLGVLRCLLATGGVTRQDIYAVLDEADAR